MDLPVREGDLHRASVSGSALSRVSATAAGQHDPPLERRDGILRADALQISRYRVAARAAPGTVEKRLPAFASPTTGCRDPSPSARPAAARDAETRRDRRSARLAWETAASSSRGGPLSGTGPAAWLTLAVTMAERVKSVPPSAPPRASTPWQKLHACANSSRPRSTAAGSTALDRAPSARRRPAHPRLAGPRVARAAAPALRAHARHHREREPCRSKDPAPGHQRASRQGCRAHAASTARTGAMCRRHGGLDVDTRPPRLSVRVR